MTSSPTRSIFPPANGTEEATASTSNSNKSCGTPRPTDDTRNTCARRISILSSASGPKMAPNLDEETIRGYEQLDKWKGCPSFPTTTGTGGSTSATTCSKAVSRPVYQHNRARAAATGFPTRLAVGTKLGLSEHETSSVFGWTTGDYRLINPIARDIGARVVEFDEYPFLPQDTAKVKCRLAREDVLPYIRVLQSALSKVPALQDRQRLWRGHRRQFCNRDTRPGSIIRLDGFTSTTRDRDRALEFATKANEGRSQKRTLMCILQHENAKCISKLSARREEGEVLFSPGTILEVVDPPGDTYKNDADAVQRAVERMRKLESMSEATIDLIYAKEVMLKKNL